MIRTKICSIITFLAAIIAVQILNSTCVLADKPVIYYADLRYAENLSNAECYDIRHTAACLQGLVNRESPRLYILYYDIDVDWLDRIRETGGLCDGWEVRTLTFEQLFVVFRHYINGLVLYDADPSTGASSTSLVATTVAGVEGGIALRNDITSSTYDYLVNDLSLPVMMDLSGKFTGTGTIWGTSTASTGSAKCDAYIWAKEKYLDTGKCDPTVLMYTLDLVGVKHNTKHYAQLPNLDYAVSRKAFCFELSPWGDEAPSDDLTQPVGTDLAT
ncbi:MAG: GxGYxYP domain-containing protein, partial [Armatimonadota bacterium]